MQSTSQETTDPTGHNPYRAVQKLNTGTTWMRQSHTDKTLYHVSNYAATLKYKAYDQCTQWHHRKRIDITMHITGNYRSYKLQSIQSCTKTQAQAERDKTIQIKLCIGYLTMHLY